MNYRQIGLINDMEVFMKATEEWKVGIQDEIVEIYAKIEEISEVVTQDQTPKRGPVAGMKELRDRVSRLETAIKRGKPVDFR